MAMLDDLPQAILANNSRTSVRVAPEAAMVLAGQADLLTLPSPGLGHLFWCLFWRDTWKAGSVEAFWMRKIIHHLERAQADAIQEDGMHASALEQLQDVNLFAIDGALESCLFQKPLPLLSRAVRLVNDTPPSAQKMDMLLAKAWECYPILGEAGAEDANAPGPAKGEAIEPLATVLLHTHAVRQSNLHIAADPAAGGPLLELFLDSMAAPELQHAGFRNEAVNWFSSRQGQPTCDYARARSAWLAFTICPSWPGRRAADGGSPQESTSSFDELEAALFARLQDPRTASSRATDLITLSLTLWCRGLLVSFREKAVEWGQALGRRHAGQEAGLGDLIEYLKILGETSTASGRDAQLRQLAESALEAVRLADELRQRPSRLAPQCDLFSQALAREICAVALSAILTACHYLNTQHAHRPSEEAIQAIDKVFRSVAASLSYGFPDVRNAEVLLSHELNKKVDDLLNLCILVWDTFGLTQLRDLLSLRRVHFFAVCQELKPHDYTAFRNLTESAGAAIGRRDFTGLIANCILADCLEPAAELASHYLCRAADVALGGNFGAELKCGFALVAIEKAHALDFDLSSFLEQILEREAAGDSFLARHFRKCPEDGVCGLALRLLNASARTKTVALASAVREIITGAVEHLKTGSVREELESLLELYELRAEFRAGRTVDLEQRLQKWENRKEIWLYAWLLEMLIEQGHNTDGVRRKQVTSSTASPRRTTTTAITCSPRRSSGPCRTR